MISYEKEVLLRCRGRKTLIESKKFGDILKYDPSQPRDEKGRWSLVGGDSFQGELFPELSVEDPARYAIAEDRVVLYRLEEREDEIIAVNDEHGSHDYHEVRERLTSLLSTAEIQIAHREWETINSILDDGRVKSQFETGESNGLFDPERRSYIESDLFNIEDDPEYDVENRPVYGTFAGDGGMWTSGLRQYGHIKMIMRPEVSQRTTFTGADSLRMHYDIEQVHFQPSLVKDPYLASLVSVEGLSDPDRIESIMSTVMTAKSASELSGYDYMEVQVHGQVRLSDIARIEIPDDPRYDPSPNTFKQLQELGIPLYAVDNLGNRRLWTT